MPNFPIWVAKPIISGTWGSARGQPRYPGCAEDEETGRSADRHRRFRRHLHVGERRPRRRPVGRPRLPGRSAWQRGTARPSGRLLAAVVGVLGTGDPRQRRLYGPRQLGDRPARRRPVQVRAVVGRRHGQPDGHLHAGDCRPLGRRDGQGPCPMLPRLVSALDALAQLAVVRGGHRRVRPGRGAGQRRGAEPDVPHPVAVGGHYHGAGRVVALGLAAVRHADHRSRRAPARGNHLASATSSRSSSFRKRNRAFPRWGLPW